MENDEKQFIITIKSDEEYKNPYSFDLKKILTKNNYHIIDITEKNVKYICSSCLGGFNKPVIIIRTIDKQDFDIECCPLCENHSFRTYEDHIKYEESLGI